MLEIDMATPALKRLVGPHASFDQIARDLKFSEGPAWNRRTGEFFYTDIVGDTIWKWKPGVGHAIVMRPSRYANGLTFDQDGRLLVAGWGGRTVWRMEHDGSITTLAAHHQGKKLNSPNDIIVRSDGLIYFTDSFGGLCNVGMGFEDVQRYIDFAGVYCVAPDGTQLRVATPDVFYPNGLCFSPNEKLLYVNDSRFGLINVYEVRRDGMLGKGSLFYQAVGPETGIPDGMKCDVEGNVYCTGPGGIHVIAPNGKLLGRLRIPDHTTNLGWGGDDWCSLYITTYYGVYRTRLRVAGVPVW